MTKKAAEHVMTRFEALGYAPQMTRKDGVLVCLGGVDKENGLLLEAHMDTLGGMVCQIKANGRLKITPIGGLRAENVETENCRVVTKFDGVIEGTAQLTTLPPTSTKNTPTPSARLTPLKSCSTSRWKARTT